jgi:hypothetical protein
MWAISLRTVMMCCGLNSLDSIAARAKTYIAEICVGSAGTAPVLIPAIVPLSIMRVIKAILHKSLTL